MNLTREPHLNATDEPPFVSLKEAAALAGVSMSTAKRRRSDLKKAGATQDNAGRWRIPVAAVEVLKGGSPLEPLNPPRGPRSEPLVTLSDVEGLRADLAKAREEVAELRARLQERTERMHRAEEQNQELVRELAANSARLSQIEAVRQIEKTVEPEQPRGGWFSRLFG